MQYVNRLIGGVIYLGDSRDTGKTIIVKKEIALALASSGIAETLMQGGHLGF